MKPIPIHDFQVDDESSVPFQLIQLTKKGSYDTSVPHRHNYYEVFIFERGGGTHRIDFTGFEIQSQSVHFVSPGQVHCVDRNEHSAGFVMLFSRDFYSKDPGRLFEFPFLNNNSEAPILNLDENEFDKLHQLILSIQEEKQGTAELAKELIQSQLNTFLIYSKRFFDQKGGGKVVLKDSLSYRFKQLVEKSYRENHNVSEYAALLSVSEKQLATATKKELGRTPKDIIHHRILLEAKRLVLHTTYSFQEIAFFLNYADAAHFSKFFKGKTGISPGQFRDKGEKYL
jgi:AraC-like DNA-binding protein